MYQAQREEAKAMQMAEAYSCKLKYDAALKLEIEKNRVNVERREVFQYIQYIIIYIIIYIYMGFC